MINPLLNLSLILTLPLTANQMKINCVRVLHANQALNLFA